ncbi:MAG TPA: hypothetical protein VFV19_03835 [Candidatus Polarisedimenticolaceae bacterium]|nr:hypothetical protein [Candidatus Polarisedimenticolaceae bacterium]
MKRDVAIVVLLVASAPAWSVAAPASDPAAAEAAYRLAQRLAADRSPDAAAAFEKVVDLAPAGPLADDALLGLARLAGAPDWPEDAAVLDPARVPKAVAPLERLLAEHADGDRALEGRYLLGLLKLAPASSRRIDDARAALITVATSPSGDPWRARARYALGALSEMEGATERAAGAYARVVVEAPGTEAAARAQVGFAREELRLERYADAAVQLQEAIEAQAPARLQAEPLRALAVRELAVARDPRRAWSQGPRPLPTVPTTRGAALLASGDGGVLAVFDRKNAALQIFDSRGGGRPPFSRDEVSAMASDAPGRIYAVAGDALLRFDGASWTAIAKLGAYAGSRALAVDAAGTVWLADRKGDRIGALAPGAAAPVLVRESRGSDVTALAAATGAIVAAEAKTGRLVKITAAGAETPFGPTFRKPVSLAVDAAGRVSVLDSKSESVTRLSPGGDVRETLPLAGTGIERPLAIAATEDGSLRILDGSTGGVVVTP